MQAELTIVIPAKNEARCCPSCWPRCAGKIYESMGPDAGAGGGCGFD